MKIRVKTLTWISVLIVVVIGVVSVSFAIYYTHDMKKENTVYATRILENLEYALDDYLDDLGVISSDVNYNYYLQNYLIETNRHDTGYSDGGSKQSVEKYEVSSKSFSDAVDDRNDITAIRIFGQKAMLLERTSYSYQYLFSDFTREEWYEKALENMNELVITGLNTQPFLLVDAEETISVSKTISSYVDGSFLGVLLIDLNLTGIAEIMERIYMENEGVLCIANEEGELVYVQQNIALDQSRIEELVHDLSQSEAYKKQTFSITDENNEFQVVAMDLERTEWTLIALTPMNILRQEVKTVLYTIVFISLFICVLVLLFLNVIMRRIVSPLEVLKEQIDSVDKGNLTVVEVIRTGDEIEELSTSFKSMLDRVQNLENAIIKEEEEKRKFEFQALQEQINPHFLYNTLDTIIWMGEAKDTRIVSVTEALARLFRISLNKGNEYLTVEDELEHVKNYLIIQEIRYKNKLTYIIEAEQEVLKLKMIKLLIQPMVENSIYHGIKKKRGLGNITVRAFQKDAKLHLQIMDNGIGMTGEQVEELLHGTGKLENKKSGIGVKNVNRRIQMICGSEYGIRCESQEGVGTTITIVLPIIEDEILWKKGEQ